MHITEYYAVFGDEVTYRIGLLLARYRLNVTELVGALELGQPQVSHKLAKLRKHSCARAARRGQCMFYQLTEPSRSLFLAADGTWRRLEPEQAARWTADHERLRRQLGPDLTARELANSAAKPQEQ